MNSKKFWRIEDFLIVYEQRKTGFDKILANKRFFDRLRRKEWIRQSLGELKIFWSFTSKKMNSTKFWRINDFLIVYEQKNEFDKVLANWRFSDRLRAKKKWIQQNFGELKIFWSTYRITLSRISEIGERNDTRWRWEDERASGFLIKDRDGHCRKFP